MSITTIKKRQDFILSHQMGTKLNGTYLIFQKRDRKDNSDSIYFGFTVTKKIGIAVIRNKIKRRLKSIIMFLVKNKKKYFENGHNYVLISKPKIIDAPFCEIRKEMTDKFLKFKENK